jgi:hypothetical protein
VQKSAEGFCFEKIYLYLALQIGIKSGFYAEEAMLLQLLITKYLFV